MQKPEYAIKLLRAAFLGNSSGGLPLKNAFAACIAISLISTSLPAQEQPSPSPEAEAPTEMEPPPAMKLNPEPDSQPESPLIQQPQTPEFNPDLPALQPPPPAQPALEPQAIPVETPSQPSENVKPAKPSPSFQNDTAIQLRNDPIARTALQSSQSTGETLLDGVGRTPAPLGSSFLGSNGAYTAGIPFGPFSLRPTLGAGVNYVSVKSSKGQSDEGALATLYTTLDLILGEPTSGRTLTASYTGSLAVGGQQGDPFDQSLALRGNLAFTKITLGLGIQFAQLSGANRDFGKETRRDLFTLSLTSSYQYSQKTSLDWDITIPVRHYADGESSVEFSSTNTLNYAYSDKTSVGLGLTLGTVAPDQGNTQKFAQIFTRAQYVLSEFITANGTVGVEQRDTGDFQRTAPVFGLGVAWRPRLGTLFSLTGDRRVLNSAADENTNYTTTSAILSIEQRLGDSFTLRASTGIEDAVYESTKTGVFTSRHDTLYTGQLSLTAQINARWVANMIVSYGNNDSSEDSLRFFQSSLLFSYNF